MSRTILIRDQSGDSLTVGEQDFPIAMGGRDTPFSLPGVSTPGPVAHLGFQDDELFIQPSEDGEIVRCNGTPVTTSRWLHPGDTLDIANGRIRVSAEGDAIALVVSLPSDDVPTEPPESPTSLQVEAETDVAVSPIPFTPKAEAARRAPGWRPHPISAALALFLAVAAAALWFIFTARAVTVEISPQPQTVNVEGGLIHPKFGGRYLLRPGDYRLQAEHSEFRPLDTVLTVTHDSSQTYRFDLVPLPGVLSVKTDPPVESTVEVDGEQAGRTPISVELELGDHEIVIRADRHEVFTTTVTIEEPGGRQDLSVELVPAWAAVTFQSEPTGAEVVVDGTAVGRTPLTTDLGAGSHRVVFRLGGFKPLQEIVTVEADQPKALPVARLVPADAVLALATNPTGASVTLDGTFAGQTPLRLALTPAVSHTIKISKAGHQSHSTTVRLEAGTSDSRSVDLEPIFGEVEILSTPAGAEILIDGESRGHTAATLRLAAVSHSLELRREGYTPYTATILPEEGLLETVRATLEPLENRPPHVATSLTTSQGARLERVPAGTVLMGASRREPGRRANEAIRQAEITRPFFLAVHEVTNDQFRQFAPEHSSGRAGGMSLRTASHPVVGVTWEDAVRYCNWLSDQEGLPPVYVERDGKWTARTPLPDGYRLPTEAEWALAARMAGGSEPRKYIWGNDLPLPKGAGNYGDSSASRILGDSLPGYTDGFPVTAPVGSFDADPLGIYDLGGNVAEWVHDAYTIYPQGAGEVIRDPTGPPEGEYHVIRGAGWMDAKLTRLRLSYREYGDEPASDVGFRIARNGN